MRKYILSSLLGLFIGACPSFGQHKVIITLNDGTTIEKYVWQVKDITFGEVSPIVVPQPGETTAVDLGLSVKWASFNIGASSEEEKGLLLGWGDITGLNTSRDLNYFPSLYPKGDIVNTKYDFVKTSWGDKWRLPSTKETQELIDKCTWTAVEDENQKVKGYMVTGPNGNHIYLPCTSKRDGNILDENNQGCYYWTGMLSSNNSNKASYLSITTDDTKNVSTHIDLENRYMGFAMRPVYGDYQAGINLQVSEANAITNTGARIFVLYSGDVENISKLGIRYATSSNDIENNYKTLEIDNSQLTEAGQNFFDINGLGYNTTCYYRAFATINGKDSLTNIKSFTTDTKYSVEWVDLGLPSGLKWAKYNLGAKSEDEYGNFFAWGDNNEKYTSQGDYDWNYIYQAPTNISGSNDYDPATYILGKGAHMPNGYDFIELREKCTWESVSSPIRGWKVIGPNGNSIFLPYNGNRQAEGNTYQQNTNAYYWTSEANSLQLGVYYTFSSSAQLSGRLQNASKYLGMGIRPVLGKSNTTDPTKGEVIVNPSPYDGAAVDLGLSVYWASYNVGATTSSEAGNKYAWGETSTRGEGKAEDYTLDNYSLYTNGAYIHEGIEEIAGTDYDVAHKEWGGDWKMPNYTEMLELTTECDWTWTTENGVAGYKITPKDHSNTNSIFMPVTDEGSEDGSYWSSTMYTLQDAFRYNSAYYLEFSKNGGVSHSNYYYRYIGRHIRPVKIKR